MNSVPRTIKLESISYLVAGVIKSLGLFALCGFAIQHCSYW